jgi:hypothetical protein
MVRTSPRYSHPLKYFHRPSRNDRAIFSKNGMAADGQTEVVQQQRETDESCSSYGWSTRLFKDLLLDAYCL